MLEEKNPSRTPISEFGYSELIHHLTSTIQHQNSSSYVGIGDDAAAIVQESELTVVSSDVLIEGVHFDLTYFPLKHLGYKAAIVQFSDLIAMGCRPQQLLVNLSCSNRFIVEAIEELYSGIRLACEKYGVDIVGGDSSSSVHGLYLSLTAIGQCDKNALIERKGAREGDLICVSGDLGGAYAGLLLLEREKAEYMANPQMQPDLAGHDYVLERQLKPEARLDLLDFFQKNEVKPTAMIDLSKGLSADLLSLCKASSLGCRIYEDKLPLDASTCSTLTEFDIAPPVAALNGGEDYELLFSVPASAYEQIKGSSDISIIGHFVEEADGYHLIPENGDWIELRAQNLRS